MPELVASPCWIWTLRTTPRTHARAHHKWESLAMARLYQTCTSFNFSKLAGKQAAVLIDLTIVIFMVSVDCCLTMVSSFGYKVPWEQISCNDVAWDLIVHSLWFLNSHHHDRPIFYKILTKRSDGIFMVSPYLIMSKIYHKVWPVSDMIDISKYAVSTPLGMKL